MMDKLLDDALARRELAGRGLDVDADVMVEALEAKLSDPGSLVCVGLSCAMDQALMLCEKHARELQRKTAG